VTFTFTAELWLWDARQAESWVFVTVPPEPSEEIAERSAQAPRRGFGSVKVHATIGTSSWSTSVFPNAAGAGYVLPVKKAVRTREGVETGDSVRVTLRLL